MTWSKVKVERTGASQVPKIALGIFSKSIFSAIYNGLFHFCRSFCRVTLKLEGSLQIVRPQKLFSDFNEIWYVDRGRCVIHDGMPCDPIQCKVKVTSAWKPLRRSQLSVPHGTHFLLSFSCWKHSMASIGILTVILPASSWCCIVIILRFHFEVRVPFLSFKHLS